jgi:hypothetical protein
MFACEQNVQNAHSARYAKFERNSDAGHGPA